MAKKKTKPAAVPPPQKPNHCEIAKDALDALASELGELSDTIKDRDDSIASLEEEIGELKDYAPEPHERAYIAGLLERARDAEQDPFKRKAIDSLSDFLERIS